MSLKMRADTIQIPARDLPAPAHLHAIGHTYLKPSPASPPSPAFTDKTRWGADVGATHQAVIPLLQSVNAGATAEVVERNFGSAPILDIVPRNADPADRSIVLEMYGQSAGRRFGC